MVTKIFDRIAPKKAEVVKSDELSKKFLKVFKSSNSN